MEKKTKLSPEDAAEQRFVRTYIRKNRRDRLLHELSAPEKRYAGISRFCHQAEELLDPARIAMEGEDLERRPEFESFVRRHDGPCRVLSLEFAPDGDTLPLRDALDRALVGTDDALIIGDGFCMVFGEAMKGGRGKYLLTARRDAARP